MQTAYIGIGSNLGDRRALIDTAIALLKKSEFITVRKVSALYETTPVGGPPQGPYVNGVLEIETDTGPEALLGILQGIEDTLGRERSEPNGPRTMDMDILLFGDVTMTTRMLTIPHPRMMEREFVLRGLREIAPERVERLCT